LEIEGKEEAFSKKQAEDPVLSSGVTGGLEVCLCLLDATLKERVEIGDEQGDFRKLSCTFEVQDPWNQGRAKNVELEGLSVTIRGVGRGRGKKDVDLEPTYLWWWRCRMETAS
jgi:hypothetical protein